jgi:phage regulator Rha-like protein
MTRQGFTLLVMGWTGDKAMAFKVRYIEAFDAMERALNETARPVRRWPVAHTVELAVADPENTRGAGQRRPFSKRYQQPRRRSFFAALRAA